MKFFDKLVLWKTKRKDCLGLIHFLSAAPLLCRLHLEYNDRLCASQAAVMLMFLSWNKHANQAIVTFDSDTQKLFWDACVRALLKVFFLAFLVSSQSREAMFSWTLRGWAGGHTLSFSVSSTATTSPFLHGKKCITAIATIASLCPQKKETEDLCCHLS